jgi:hypothetical protein
MGGGARFTVRTGILTFHPTASRPDMGLTQPPIKWVLVATSLGGGEQGCEDSHSLASNTEIKNVWSYTFTPHTSSWRVLN